MLVRSETLSTTPSSPSGATTGSNGRDAVARTRAEQQRPAVGGLRLVQHLGGDVSGREPVAQREELAQPLVLGEQGRQGLGEVGGGVTLGGDGAEADPAGLPFLGAGLQPDQRGQHGLPEGGGDAHAPGAGREQADEREAETDDEQHGVPARVRTFRRAGHAQTDRTLRYFS